MRKTTLVLISALALMQGASSITLQRTKRLDHLRMAACATSPTGSTFAAALEDHSVRIMNASKGETIKILQGHPQPVYALAFSPNGKLLASGDESARIWIWDVPTGKRIRQLPTLHSRGIQALNFSKDGSLLASTGKDDVIRIWNIKTGKPAGAILGKGSNVSSATFVGNSGLVAAGTLGSGLCFYKIKGFTPAGSADAHGKQGVMDIAINPEGTKAISGGRDGCAACWDIKSHRCLKKLKGHQDWVAHVALSPNGKFAATSSNDRRVILWDLASGKTLSKLENQSAVGAPVAFTGDGKYLITASDSDAIEIYILK